MESDTKSVLNNFFFDKIHPGASLYIIYIENMNGKDYAKRRKNKIEKFYLHFFFFLRMILLTFQSQLCPHSEHKGLLQFFVIYKNFGIVKASQPRMLCNMC
jgi:hypothetical protein